MRVCSKWLKRCGAMEKSFLRIFSVLVVVALLLFFSSCTDTSTAQPEAEDTPFVLDTSVKLTAPVTVESETASLTVQSLGFSGYYGPELSVVIQNRTDRTLLFQVHQLCVNGFVVGTMMSEEAAPSEEVAATLTLLQSDLEDACVSSIETITVSFIAYDPEASKAVWTTESIELQCTGRACENAEPDKSGMTVYQDGGLSVVMQDGLSTLEGVGKSARFYVENTTDRTVLVQCFSAKVNGVAMYPLFSCTIPPHCRAFPYMTFLNSSLEENGIESLETVELSLTFMDSATYATLAQTEWFTWTVS